MVKRKKEEKILLKNIALLIIALTIIYILSSVYLKTQVPVRPAPPFFHEFYGTATCVSTNNVLDDTIIKAVVKEQTDPTQTTETDTVVKNGQYLLLVEGYTDQDDIDFYIGAELVGTAKFIPFSTGDQKDLVAADESYCTAPVPNGNGPGGDPGGGSTSTSTPTPTPTPTTTITQCNDKLDNDHDGFIDFGSDPQCSSPTDDSEGSLALAQPACNDNIDNDGDGFIDYPDDSGCESYSDSSEIDEPEEETPTVQVYKAVEVIRSITLYTIIPLIVIFAIISFVHYLHTIKRRKP